MAVLAGIAPGTAHAADADGTAPAPAAPDGTGDRGGYWGVERRPDGGLRTVDLGTDPQAGVRSLAAAEDAGAGRGVLLSLERDAVVRALGAPDPMRPQQWALDVVSFEPAWSLDSGGGAKVAVIDTGVRGTHQDLAGQVLPGKDYVGTSDGRVDPGGHGTNVAGIIAAATHNGVGVSGAAPNARILPVRALGADGTGYLSDVTAGIIWAVDHGARVVNLSLGGPSPSEGLHEAIKYAVSKRAVVVAAAGNGGDGAPPIYPAAYPETIAVGAVRPDRTRASFSQIGSYVDVVAPGEGIVGLWGSNDASYAWATGTSMAAPFVAAEAAIVASESRFTFSAALVRNRIESTAVDLGVAGRDPVYGAGLINPRAAALRSKPLPEGWNTQGTGYWIVSAGGAVRTFGKARFYGDLGGRPLPGPIVASATTPTGNGYWLAGADGSVYAFGGARHYGSMRGRRLNGPIVGMAATPDGRGYYLLGRDGGIFSFGSARFKGSTGAMRLNAPVLDMATTATGKGYWLVAADGGIFSFGDARFHGSTGAMRLWSPATSMAAADGRGYWIVARDGGIFAFNAPYHGSLPGIGIQSASAGQRIRALQGGKGYYILGTQGQVWRFGTARYFGSASSWSFRAVDLMLVPGV